MSFVLAQLSPAELRAFRALRAARSWYWADYQLFLELAPHPDGSPKMIWLDAEAYRQRGIAVPDWFAALPPDPERDLHAAIDRHVKEYSRRRLDGDLIAEVPSERPPAEPAPGQSATGDLPNATTADLDACIDAIAARAPDGCTDRQTLRDSDTGVVWLREQRRVKATGEQLYGRFMEGDIHARQRRRRGAHRPRL